MTKRRTLALAATFVFIAVAGMVWYLFSVPRGVVDVVVYPYDQATFSLVDVALVASDGTVHEPTCHVPDSGEAPIALRCTKKVRSGHIQHATLRFSSASSSLPFPETSFVLDANVSEERPALLLITIDPSRSIVLLADTSSVILPFAIFELRYAATISQTGTVQGGEVARVVSAGTDVFGTMRQNYRVPDGSLVRTARGSLALPTEPIEPSVNQDIPVLEIDSATTSDPAATSTPETQSLDDGSYEGSLDEPM